MAHSTGPEPATAGLPHPLQTAPGVLIHPAADRRLAVSQWLLGALPEHERPRAHTTWQTQGVILLPLGHLFSAVRLPTPLVLAAASARRESAGTDEYLAAILDGGPVICDPIHRHYYALVRATVPRTWTAALDDWRTQDVDVLGRDTYLGVPHPGRTRDDGPQDAFWAVPMEAANTLCAPLSVARLIATGAHQLAERAATA